MHTFKIVTQPLPDHEFPDPFHVRMPKHHYNQLRMHSDSFTLTCGSHRVPITIEAGSDGFEISHTLTETLFLPLAPLPLHIKTNVKSKILSLGPVFAVLTHTADRSEAPFGSLTPFYEELARFCAQKHVLVYFFSLKKTSEQTIVGYRLNHEQWHKQRFPYPDVIYNRLSSRKRESQATAQQFFKRCKTLRIPYFNERFLNKWEVHEALFKLPEFKPYLPETVLYRHTSDLDAMLQKHDHLFLKPIHGSLGRKIIRIKHNSHIYSIGYTGFSTNESEQIDSLLALLKTVIPKMRKQTYIIQQGIDIVTCQGRPLDFRILCNKNRNGIWKVTTTVARVSAERQFVSNLARGATIFQLEEALSEAFTPQEIRNLKKLLIELALNCAEALDRETEGIYGELGIDLAVDGDGKPWLLEINTKPSKADTVDFTKRTIRPSAKAITNFAAFLSRF